MSCKKEPGCCEVGVAIAPMDGVDCFADPCATQQSCDPCDNVCETDTSLYAIATAPFNMPACGQTTDFQTKNALRFAPGSVLYSPGVGSLYVAGVRDNWTLILRNDCGSCQVLLPGQVVSQNTVFALGGPGCFGNGSSVDSPETTPFLDSDLVVPAVGLCATVKVTNVFGLNVGDIVSINTFLFRIGAIIDGTTIQLCNDGEGGEPNSVIQHDPDNDGNPNYPLIRVGGENPCTGDAVTILDRILGCSGAGQQVGVEGSTEGHILVWNNTTDKWELRVLEGAQVCVVMSEDLIVDPGADPDDELVVFTSLDNSLLEAEWDKVTPNFLRISIDGNPFCMTEPVSTGAIKVRRAYTPGGIEVIEEGALICVEGCCDQCTAYVETSDFLGGANPDITETGFIQAPIIISAAAGVSVRTFPVGIGSAGTGSTPDTDAAWVLRYINGDSCACRKYLEIMSNFECAIDLQNGVYANVEFRIMKVIPNGQTQAFAAIPFGTNRRLLPAMDNTPNLLEGGNPGNFGTINTYKGFMFDRDIVEPGVLHQYQGHIRIVFENTTGGPLDCSFACNQRAWLKAGNFELIADPVP